MADAYTGTHKVLTAQVRRDLDRMGLTGTVLDRTLALRKGITDPELGDTATRAAAALEELGAAIRVCVDDPGHGALHFRAHHEGLVRAHQVALLLDAADGGEGEGEAANAAELAAAATLLTGRYLDPDYRPERDPRFTATIDRLLGADLDV